MNIFFTSDTHFGHKNIIKYCDRPFESVGDMDDELVDRWNAVVQPNDTVYHLGDFAFAGTKRITELTARLNGSIVLVAGNHDKQITRSNARLLGFYDYLHSGDLLAFGHSVYLGHHPIPYTLPPQFSTQFCGHVHEIWKYKHSRYSTVVNVGVDQWDYKPVVLDELLGFAESVGARF